MHGILNGLMTALLALDGAPAAVAAPQALARPGVPAANRGPMVDFEIRDLRVANPGWRGKLLLKLQPVTRQEGCAVWSLDAAGVKELLDLCMADTKGQILQAPKMTASVGEPVRMTSEETVHYVASLKRVADGPANHSARLAFEPQVDKVHSGVRVHILSSQLKEQKLFAKVEIQENRLIALHNVRYSETVQPKPGTDPAVVRTSLLERLNPNHPPHAAAITASIQVPEVESRRIEGEWLIPSDGALIVSLGPRAVHERGFLKGHEEHLIAITARPAAGPGSAQPAPAGVSPASTVPPFPPSVTPSTEHLPPAITPSIPNSKPR